MLAATVFVAFGLAFLLGLGIWQLERKTSKENLIAQIVGKLAVAPQPLPPSSQWASLNQEDEEFRRVTFTATFSENEVALVYTPGSALRPDVTGPGYWVLSPGHLPEGRIVIVDRGFLPLDRKDVLPTFSGTLNLTGVLRWPESRGLFTPADDPQKSIWFARDPQVIAAAKNWGAVPQFYVAQETPQSLSAWPRSGKIVVDLPNNHLQYAITWFGLAGGLAAVYLVWLFGRLRRA